MIGRLSGVLLEKMAPELLLDVQGVGYELQVPMSTLYQLPELGAKVTLFTHLVVREDAQQLYGFADVRERALFRALIKVNGVGPKLALTILSGIETDEFVRCVQDNDSASLVRLPGVGKKTAERLLIEMRDRLKDWQGAGVAAQARGVAAPLVSAVAEAESALQALGYKAQEAARAIKAVNSDDSLSSEQLIRAALRSMVKN